MSAPTKTNLQDQKALGLSKAVRERVGETPGDPLGSLFALLVLYQGQELHFSPREFERLAHLMRQPGRVHSRTELIRDLWCTVPDTSNVINVHLANMRVELRAVEPNALLWTVRRMRPRLHAQGVLRLVWWPVTVPWAA